jgi:hypothetical protein
MVEAGSVAFAGALLMVTGLVNVFQAFVAWFSDDQLVVRRENFVVVDTTAWGWALMISGLLLMAVGGGLLAASGWARIVAIVVVGLHAVVQIAWIGAYPIWSILMIALSVVVLWSLTARWTEVRDRLGGTGKAPWSAVEGPHS